VFGGEQEHGNRTGTENLAGIVAMRYALTESINEMEQSAARLQAMTEETYIGIKKHIPIVRLNGSCQ
jgi:cysteine desulfurase